ncbi:MULTISPECIES: type II secretion system F family protein [unclassified Janibacter]|uniref:type II secretion system F family protein n=1 Tax=unclassified Janibacter TaxID=2649294 RepID=UPI003D07FBCB
MIAFTLLTLLAAVTLWPGRRVAMVPVSASRRVPDRTCDTVADGIVLLALALRSGCSVPEALGAAANASAGPVADDLRRVAVALTWGHEGAQAWAHVPGAWAPAALALTLAQEAGASPSDALLAAARRLRSTEARRLEAAAARAGVALVIPLGLLFLPAFLCTAVLPVIVVLAGEALS